MEDFNNYEINWKDAPDWAIAHAFDKNGIGYFYGLTLLDERFCVDANISDWVIGSEVLKFHEKTWTKSLTFRPTINK
jgi:hypothetical protein